jgi:NrS-1  polymerase HBD domain
MDHGLMQAIPTASSAPQPAIPCNPASVPLELRERHQWVVWRYVVRGGKPTKVPLNPKTGGEAKSTSPPTWSSFADAVHSLGEGSIFAGVGFVFSPDDPFTGIDLDDCIVEGKLVPAAQQIVDAFGTYTEVSPSGNGVKMIVRGRKPQGARCKSKTIEGFKETEVYDAKRFFTLTGRRLPGTPESIADGQVALDDLCRRLWPPKQRRTLPVPTPGTSAIPDDQSLLTRMFRSKHGDAIRRLWDGDTSAHGNDQSAADLALCNHLAFWTGRDRNRMDRLFRGSGLYRAKWEREDYRDWTLTRAIEDCIEVYSGPGNRSRQGNSRPSNGAARRPPDMTGDKPTIHIDVDEHRVIAETVAALTADLDLYQRGNVLVRVLREKHSNDGVIRPEGSATIVQVPMANLRERMTRHAHFTKNGPQDSIVPAHPVLWLVAGVDARGEWPGIRHLMGVSDSPILRADGSIWQTPGYDDVTGVLFEPPPGVAFPPVHPDVSADDADAALTDLLELVCDFRFEAQEHKSAWLAALLTPLARFAFAGPTPLFLIDANIRGAGKGLLAQTIGQIVLGREMPVSSYAHDTEEMRKKITSLAIAGDRMVLLDNLEGTFGNDALDRALTSTRWKDRILGKSEQVDLPLLPVWYGTGNNVQVAADTTRRIIHVRLDVLDEHPEDRTGFRHPDLIGWVKQERGRLLSAALTILSAYIRCGKPKQDLTPYGSFEGWSRLVREAVAWVGMPDPCLTRVRLTESADTTADALTQLIDAWRQFDPHNVGIVVAEMLARLYPADHQYQPRDEASVVMRAALENAVGCPPGKAPSNRQVGNKLKGFRRRVVEGCFLDTDDTKTKHGARWRLMRAAADGTSTPASGDSADSGESISALTREGGGM